MYIPPLFKEDRLDTMQDVIREADLGLLITHGTTGLFATHLPILFDPEPGPNGALIGHIAKANPQWETAEPGQDGLAIFMGPDAYVSPAWYATKQETGRVVPTWNYVAVHAYGKLEFFHDPARLLDLVTRLTQKHEEKRADPWAVSDAPENFVAAQLRAIVGFRMVIDRLEGKSKMSQNRTPEDRAGVIKGLSESADPDEQAVAKLIKS
jgi:transcriptional regulator